MEVGMKRSILVTFSIESWCPRPFIVFGERKYKPELKV